jgi:hypothetical protein
MPFAVTNHSRHPPCDVTQIDAPVASLNCMGAMNVARSWNSPGVMVKDTDGLAGAVSVVMYS